MTNQKEAGTLKMELDGQTYEASWRLEDGVVSVYVGDFGPLSTLQGGSPAEVIARHLLQEFLEGRRAQIQQSQAGGP